MIAIINFLQYVWVLYYPINTFCPQTYNASTTATQNALKAGVVKVSVKGTAPARVVLFHDNNASVADTQYTSDSVPAGGSVDVYAKGSIGSGATLTEADETMYDYVPTVPAKLANDVTITNVGDVDGHYKIQVSNEFFVNQKIKDGKNGKVTIPFVCDKNGKKANFVLNVVNVVTQTTFGKLSTDMGDATVTTDNKGIVDVKLPDARDKEQKVTLEENVTLSDGNRKRSDGKSIFRFAIEKGFTYNANSSIKTTEPLGTQQKKVSIAAVKKQDKQYLIKAAKGTQPGTQIYGMIWHNSYTRTNGKGYRLIRITVGTANHAKSMKLTGLDEEAENKVVTSNETSKGMMTVEMKDSSTKASSFTFKTEVVSKQDASKDTTDIVGIYKLPRENGYYVTTGKDVKVVGGLTAGQKKVSVALVKGTKDTYRVTAARGTPVGTEAYFMVYYNENCYAQIAVTVGETNKVKSSNLVEANGLSITTGTVDEIKVATPTKKSITRGTFKETLVLEKYDDKPQTDVTAVLRILSPEAFTVVPNRSGVTAVGACTASQKKIALTYTKKTGLYTVTAAKGTAEGTDAYFIIYHNDKYDRGHHIVHVTVGG